MKFIRIQCKGNLNSFRQPDFHTYHKTFPLPLKTTVGGMLGSAMGVSPDIVNQEWLLNDRFRMGVVGVNEGKARDLWQIRKYENKQIKAFSQGKEGSPYKTAVIVRELLYASQYAIYLSFSEEADYKLIFEKLNNPEWALSLGREDELVLIQSVKIMSLEAKEDLYYRNTVLPSDLSEKKYKLNLGKDTNYSINLLDEAPQIVKVPTAFSYDKTTLERVAVEYKTFSFINNMPISLPNEEGFFDEELNHSFQIF